MRNDKIADLQKTSSNMRTIALSLVFTFFLSLSVTAQTPAPPAGGSESAAADTLNNSILASLNEEDIPKALKTLENVDLSTLQIVDPFLSRLSAASGGLHRSLAQLGTDEQYEVLHKWSMPTATQMDVHVLTSLVPEVAPPMEFARATGQRPKKESFAIATVGDMPGLWCSAWTMIVAADDAGNLRQLVTELEGLAEKKTTNADFVLTLAKIHDSHSTDADLIARLTARVAPEGEDQKITGLHDAVLVSAAMQRTALGPVCEQIVERLNQFHFTNGSSPHAPFLRRLRATVILKNRSPETDPETVLYESPQLWIAADDQKHDGSTTGSDRAIWLTHEDHIKRLSGPGDDFLLFKYPMTGTFELKGEVTAMDHGSAGLTYGGVAFDANPEKFTVKEVQRTHFESRIWPFVAPKELRMFNRVNIRSDREKITFLSNLHPGWNGTAASCSSSPWLGLRAFGDGRVYFRNLELVGEPHIPREVRIADSGDLRGWGTTYGETVPKVVMPFQADPAAGSVTKPTDWSVAEGVIHGRIAATPEADQVAQSHLVYVRPLLDGETVSYEFYHEDGKATVHPALGRLAFLMESGGVRMHWMTDNENEWTGLTADNAIVEPLNRRGPRSLPLKNADWNLVTMKLNEGRVSLTLNGEEICERPLDDLTSRHIGFYHDRNTSAVQIRNVVLTGDWPEKLTSEQLGNLVATGSR
ncbi:MAG: DUF1583 domain-containing protein [Planctomycetaceae bacterium]